jgi:hypothetical protein
LRDGGLTAFPDLGGRTLFNRLAADAAEAESLAQADLDRAVARAVLLEAVVEGDTHLRPGRPVNLEGVGDLVDGRCVVTRALHRFEEARGYVVEISTEPPARSDRPRVPAFTLGKVTDADDPDGLARVRARLPVLGDVETGWMSVLLLGAGAEKGVAILPEPTTTCWCCFRTAIRRAAWSWAASMASAPRRGRAEPEPRAPGPSPCARRAARS